MLPSLIQIKGDYYKSNFDASFDSFNIFVDGSSTDTHSGIVVCIFHGPATKENMIFESSMSLSPLFDAPAAEIEAFSYGVSLIKQLPLYASVQIITDCSTILTQLESTKICSQILLDTYRVIRSL